MSDRLQQKLRATRQLATMIGAGLPLVQALDVLARPEPDGAGWRGRVVRSMGRLPGALATQSEAVIFAAVRDAVAAGHPLADALGRHPRVFSSLYVGMVAAGEAGGALDEVLERLADMLERQHALRRKVSGALTYPAVVLGVSVLTVAVLLTVVLPTFAEMFASAGVPLPGPTRFVLALTEAVRRWGWLALGAGVGGVFGVRRLADSEPGSRWLHGFMLRVPGVGAVLRTSAVARLTRTLATLLHGGVPLLEALDLSAGTTGNRVIESAVRRARRQVEAGRPLAPSLGESHLLPQTLIRMVDVGERTGALDTLLLRVADASDQDVDAAVARFTALLEPALILGLGLVVGGMIIAMYLPIFDMVGVMG